MSRNLVINPNLEKLNYSSYFPLNLNSKAIRSSSFLGTNIYNLPNTLPYLSFPLTGEFADKYPKSTEYSEAYPVDSKSSKCPKGKSQLIGFLTQKHSIPIAGRVEPQLNGLPGGFADKYPKGAEYSKSSRRPKGKPDLNYFFPSQCDLTHGVELSPREHSLLIRSGRALP